MTIISDNNNNDNNKISENYQRYRFRSRPRCPIKDCEYQHADSIPNKAIILDLFTEKDKQHIKQYHIEC